MAWTEQCKIAFKVNATARYHRGDCNKSLAKILRELSVESGIPYKTLKRWYYEKNRPKNEPTVNTEDNSEKNENNDFRSNICVFCEEKPVKINPSSKKPYSEKSKYYGLCSACMKQKEVEQKLGPNIHCPHCGKKFRWREGVKCQT